MVLQGFIDDSDSGRKEGSANPFVLAGFLSTAEEWALFSDEWEVICAHDPKTPDWHMAEAYRVKGDYRWKGEAARDRRIEELISLIKRRVRYRVDAVVSAGNYDLAVLGKLPHDIDHPYFICFYGVILSVAYFMIKINIEGTVDWVFDDQSKLGDECVRWYRWVKDNSPREVRSRLGSTPIFRHDKDVLPLKAADMYAWQIRRYLDKEQPQNVSHNDQLESFSSIPGVSCYFTPEQLEELVLSGGINLQFNARHRLR